jgi:tetratricopeptide (TPR) repeat protein
LAIDHLKIWEQDTSLDPRLYFQALVNMAGCYTCLNKNTQSITYFKKAINIAN